jgi:hypothetical protein
MMPAINMCNTSPEIVFQFLVLFIVRPLSEELTAGGRVRRLGPVAAFFPPKQFFADNGDLRWRGNAELDPVAVDGDDGDRYRAARDDDPFPALPTEDEHGNPSLNDSL